MLGVFISWPFLALAPAAVFAVLYHHRRQRVVFAAALAWLAYFPYEQGMRLRLLCFGECNIRVDLLLFYPLLAILSIAAIILYALARRRGAAAPRALIAAALLLLAAASSQAREDRKSETVVFLHGMGRTRASMAIIAKRFESAGYETLNFPYTQKGTSLDALSASLAAYLDKNVRTPRYHLVAHSLGNIIIRNALRKSLKPGLGRIVMLAPPNNAVPLAKLLKDNGLCQWITHDSGQKLSEEAFYEDLPAPSVEFGIIAGDRGNRLTSPGLNDGILDVELTRLPGMKAFVTVHHTHSLIMNAKDTFVYSKRFIETGAFE